MSNVKNKFYIKNIESLFLLISLTLCITVLGACSEKDRGGQSEAWAQEHGAYGISDDFSEIEGVTADPDGVANIEFIGGGLNDAALGELVALKPRLYGLNIGHTKVTDQGLKFLSEITFLQKLDVSGIAISDEGVKSISKLKQLRHLNINEVGISDVGLGYLGLLPELKSLTLFRVNVSGIGFEQFPNAGSRLESLNMSKSSLNDAGAVALERLTNLRYLEIPGSKISGSALNSLGKLPKLQTLYLQSTNITDASIAHLISMKALRNLILDDTPISDKALPFIGKMKSLETLSLIGTKLSKEAIIQLKVELPKTEITSNF